MGKSFEEFVQAHSRGLLRTWWLLTGTWAAAEDLGQTALAKRRHCNGEVVVEVLPDGPPRYFRDLSEAETADALGCAVGTVKSQTSRALTALRGVPGLRALTQGEVG